MAEAVLEVALENLSSLIESEVGLILGVNDEMIRLSNTLTTIKAVLEDAMEKQFTNIDLKNWLERLKDSAHVLDDILDECSTEALALESQGLLSRSADKVRSSFLSYFHPKPVLFCYKIAKKVKEIRERLDEIAEERIKFHLCETVTKRRIEVMEWRHATSIVTRPQVYGREEDKEMMVDFLVGLASNSDDVLVYPFVGIGGLGKTTLAQLVFNHEKVVNHFELRIWVSASRDFSLKIMTKAIIESASRCTSEDLDLETLQRRLQDMVRRRRYLLVLDNLWNVDQEQWDKLKYILSCGSKGASVLVTTRFTQVASVMGTMPPHQLPFLSEENCWELFKQQAFGSDEVERLELVAIGKETVKKCVGVPLAIVTIGSLLHFKSEEKA